MRLSIRWRLAFWNALAFAVVLLGFVGILYGFLAHALYEQLDSRLLTGFQQIRQDRRLAEDFRERLRYWVHELHEHSNIFCAVYAPGGTLYDHTCVLAADSIPEFSPAPPDPPRHFSCDLPIVGRQRLLEGRLRQGGSDYTVFLMLPLEEVDREMGHLVTALSMAVPAALLIAGAAAYLLARKALAPMQQLRRSTREITADRLDRRLPVLNPDDEVGGLALTINEMIGRLERSFAEIRRFTADASHELRTPLTAIRTETEVALRAEPGAVAPQALLGSILEECDRLARLTDQLLALSREDVGVGVQVNERLDLSALVREVAENMNVLAEARSVGLRSDSDGAVFIHGDEARLRQVFYNLIDNAIKYTPPGGTVHVRVAASADDAVVTVRDTGIGIAPEHLPHVFERFYRVDKARSREQGGTGLGLSISQSIVTAHGGKIELTSAPGRGTVCTVSFPLAGD
jgi:heavy metal sensor kinase